MKRCAAGSRSIGRHDVGAERVAESRIVLQRVRIGLADQFARHVRMIEPLGDAMHHRVLERVVMQDRGIDEARKLGLAPRHLLGFVADARPDRIDLVEPVDVLSCCWAMSASTLTGRAV